MYGIYGALSTRAQLIAAGGIHAIGPGSAYRENWRSGPRPEELIRHTLYELRRQEKRFGAGAEQIEGRSWIQPQAWQLHLARRWLLEHPEKARTRKLRSGIQTAAPSELALDATQRQAIESMPERRRALHALAREHGARLDQAQLLRIRKDQAERLRAIARRRTPKPFAKKK